MNGLVDSRNGRRTPTRTKKEPLRYAIALAHKGLNPVAARGHAKPRRSFMSVNVLNKREAFRLPKTNPRWKKRHGEGPRRIWTAVMNKQSLSPAGQHVQPRPVHNTQTRTHGRYTCTRIHTNTTNNYRRLFQLHITPRPTSSGNANRGVARLPSLPRLTRIR